jgi:hypothetical protein
MPLKVYPGIPQIAVDFSENFASRNGHIPALGFKTTPPMPLPKPLMKPATPSFFAPSKGWVTKPEIPS